MACEGPPLGNADPSTEKTQPLPRKSLWGILSDCDQYLVKYLCMSDRARMVSTPGRGRAWGLLHGLGRGLCWEEDV